LFLFLGGGVSLLCITLCCCWVGVSGAASVLEFCGQGSAGCGTSLSVQNHAVLRVNASLFQHNYNHLQILNHPIIRSGRRERGGLSIEEETSEGEGRVGRESLVWLLC